MNNAIKSYRVKRPKEYDELMKLLVSKEGGVFETLKGVLIFSASIGFKYKKRIPVNESGERIAFTLFDDRRERPFIYALAITEFNDVTYLREEKFEETIRVFEEYAAGGLSYLNEILDKDNVKESIESILADVEERDIITDLADEFG
jgi:dnd system-associated protein 4